MPSHETPILFSPITIGSAVIPNRFVRSATHDFMADRSGDVTPRQVDLYRRLAEGGVGLIISGHAYVETRGKASPFQIGAEDDSRIHGLRLIPQAVHETGSRVFLQIAHAGRQTNAKICGCAPIAPSPVFEPSFNITPEEMTAEDIAGAIENFIRAGVRAREAGFDGVQLHMAHGYLLSGFLSPYTNRRTDAWGGTSNNRVRIAVEILKGLKERTGPDFPVIVKLNSEDFLPGGLEISDSIDAARILERNGVDAVEVSGGMAEAGKGSVWKGQRSEEDEGYFLAAAAAVKSHISVPVFGLGGLRSLRIMEAVLTEGRADMISLSRPFIREPDLARKFRDGESVKSGCISCNGCFNPRGIACAVLRKESLKSGS